MLWSEMTLTTSLNPLALASSSGVLPSLSLLLMSVALRLLSSSLQHMGLPACAAKCSGYCAFELRDTHDRCDAPSC